MLPWPVWILLVIFVLSAVVGLSVVRATRVTPLVVSISSSQMHPKGLILTITISGTFQGFGLGQPAVEFVKKTMEEHNPAAVAFNVLDCNGDYPDKKVANAVVMALSGKSRPCVIAGTSRAARTAMAWLTWDHVTDGSSCGPIRYFRDLQDGIADLKAWVESGAA